MIAYENAVAKAIQLIDTGAILTVAAILKAAGRQSRSWASTNGLGAPEKIRRVASRFLVEQMRQQVEAIDTALPPAQRVAAIAGILVPEQLHRAHAWALVYAGWDLELQLAIAISHILAGDAGGFALFLGVGVLGVAKVSLLPNQEMSRAEIYWRLSQMTGIVEHIDDKPSGKALP